MPLDPKLVNLNFSLLKPKLKCFNIDLLEFLDLDNSSWRLESKFVSMYNNNTDTKLDIDNENKLNESLQSPPAHSAAEHKLLQSYFTNFSTNLEKRSKQ